MQNPIDVNVDHVSGSGYVRYQPFRPGIVASTIRLNPDILADFAADGSIVGIELLSIDDDTLGEARDFANKHGLGFFAIETPAG